MTSITPTIPTEPDFAALLAELADLQQQARDLLGQTGPITPQATRIQGAIARILLGLLLVAKAMTAEHATATGTVRVRVFHNNHAPESFVTGYNIDHTVTEVFAYDETDLSPETDDLQLAYRAFELFNIGDDLDFGLPDTRAVAYRELGNRSLSVGDLLAIHGVFYALQPSGWCPLPRIEQRQWPGTTPRY